MRAESAVEAVAIRIVAVGDVDVSIAESGIDVLADNAMSFSATPNTAARKERKKVSKVRNSTL